MADNRHLSDLGVVYVHVRTGKYFRNLRSFRWRFWLRGWIARMDYRRVISRTHIIYWQRGSRGEVHYYSRIYFKSPQFSPLKHVFFAGWPGVRHG